MVSELVLLRPAWLPTDDGFYVQVGKVHKKESFISDLKSFIDRCFNLPCPQVVVGEDGGAVISGLYEGIPDEADYSHERFDHVLDLVGWIEGCVEFPTRSNSTASQVLEETLKPQEPLIVEVGSTLKSVQGLGRNEAKISPALMKESSCFGARHMLDEMSKPVADLKTIEVSDLLDARPLLAVNKEFSGLIKSLEELSVQDGLSFDPGGKFRIDLAWNFNVSGDDDVWDVARSIVGNVLMMGEQLTQMETIDGSNVAKEVVDSVAHHMLDEMPKLIFSFNAISDTPILPGAPSIGVLMSEFGQKFIFNSKPVVTDCYAENFACSISITMWVAHDKVGSVMFDLQGTLLELFVCSYFGFQQLVYGSGIMEEEKWKGFILGGPLISHKNELVADYFDLKSTDLGKSNDLRCINEEINLVVANSLSNLLVSLIGGHSVNDYGRMMNGSVESLIFDPGGVKVACAHCATLVLSGIYADFCYHFRANSDFSHAKDKSEYVMFDPGGQQLKFLTEVNIDEFQFIKVVMLNFNERRKEVLGIRSNEEKGKPFNPGVFLVMKRSPIMNGFDVSVIASTIRSRGLHVKAFNEGKFDILAPTCLLRSCAPCLGDFPYAYYMFYKDQRATACIGMNKHIITCAVSAKCTSKINFLASVSFVSCNWSFLITLLGAFDIFSMGTSNFSVVFFDPSIAFKVNELHEVELLLLLSETEVAEQFMLLRLYPALYVKCHHAMMVYLDLGGKSVSFLFGVFCFDLKGDNEFLLGEFGDLHLPKLEHVSELLQPQMFSLP